MEEKLSFELTFPELLTVIKGLKKLPYEESATAIGNINAQYETQLKAKEEAARESKKEVAK